MTLKIGQDVYTLEQEVSGEHCKVYALVNSVIAWDDATIVARCRGEVVFIRRDSDNLLLTPDDVVRRLEAMKAQRQRLETARGYRHVISGLTYHMSPPERQR